MSNLIHRADAFVTAAKQAVVDRYYTGEEFITDNTAKLKSLDGLVTWWNKDEPAVGVIYDPCFGLTWTAWVSKSGEVCVEPLFPRRYA